jgi:hypothetical protein
MLAFFRTPLRRLKKVEAVERSEKVKRMMK